MAASNSFYFNNPWKPVSHSYIKDEQLRRKIDTDGYAVVKLLSDEALAALNNLYSQTHNIANGEGGMFYSVYSQDLNYRKKMHDEIGNALKPYLDEMLTSYKMMLNSFIVKASGPKSEFYVHQDTTGLDEFTYSPLSLWIPLHDITETNGAVCVVPGSHKMFSPYRSISFPAPYDHIHKAVKKYLVPLYMKAGEVLVFDNRIIHNSMANLSGTERVVAISGVFPPQAPLLTCWKDVSKNDAPIEVIEHADDYLLTHPNFLINCHARPETGKTVAMIKDEYPMVDEPTFDAICETHGIKAVNLLQSELQAEECVMIGEPVVMESNNSNTQLEALTVEDTDSKNIFEKIKGLFN